MTYVLLPIFIGGLIYIVSRSKSLKMFDWFEKINLSNEVSIIRDYFSNVELPNWIIYNLPDFLWVFSFTSLLFIIWNKKIEKENVFYLLFPMGIGVLSEFGQLFSIINGTFDKVDIIFYVFGGLSSIYIISKFKINNYEKTVTTHF
ncbi:hypothetical protein LPB303_14810 [Polaribacter atrinae]|uniref:VanZ-like domain-containing protein n=1 Tax=Polaribacter atrinae TaxID=1333662 RepID=A0A176T4G3_9FLAO|nr:hypothetical protein LPB303_14810 [Polaribacter atrinae]